MKFSISINIKPKRVVAPSRIEVLSKIKQGHMVSFSKWGQNLITISTKPTCDRSDTYVRVYSLEKRNKVVERKRVGTKTISKVLSQPHWIGHYYDIPIAVLDLSSTKTVQHHRWFELVAR